MSAAELGRLIIGGSWALHLSLIVLITAYGFKKGLFDTVPTGSIENRTQNYLGFNISANICALIFLFFSCMIIYGGDNSPGSKAFVGPLGIVVITLGISAIICAAAIPSWSKPSWIESNKD